MKYNISDLANSSNSTDPGTAIEGMNQAVGSGYGAAQYGAQKLSGYNEGFQKALSTFEEIIWVIFLAQVIQIVTHRLLYREYPLSITVSHPLTGEDLYRFGSDYQPSDRVHRVIEIVDGALFAASLTLSAYLFLQIVGIPAYTFEVTTR